ncbi:hypothetical protein Afil01_47490 [Actinorhabdospora filicis]|uniref:MmcQ/YjbR family DNA-binding protein n=1 Tax=Actinorhabdospora filicis TaxID=1785913 RepID=A0A9W6W534_9ACTN|nr:MmcQ/YjbR family DNA-binding protein [Actinorhabdospora filicis]GLZ79942.1 hypothetical protein Afil01_47490 [Actinorhabdospora filicis]
MIGYEDVREWVLALPGCREVFVGEWGRFTLRVGEKVLVLGHEGEHAVTVKASREEQAMLLERAPEVYSKAPYVGRFGWVLVDLAKADPDELREIVEDAWRGTAPKKLVREHDGTS